MFEAVRRKNGAHQVEAASENLRDMMLWIGAGKMVDKAKKQAESLALRLKAL